MKQNTFSVHFVIRSNRVDKKGLVPIYSRIIINGELIQFSLSQKIISNEWDSTEEKAKENVEVTMCSHNCANAFVGWQLN